MIARRYFRVWCITAQLLGGTWLFGARTDFVASSTGNGDIAATCIDVARVLSPFKQQGLSQTQLDEIYKILRNRPSYEKLKKIELLASGGESVVLRLKFDNRADRVLVLNRERPQGRGAGSLYHAWEIVKGVKLSRVDPEGVEHLPHFEDIPRIEIHGIPIGLVWEHAAQGSLASFFLPGSLQGRYLKMGSYGFRALLQSWRQIALGVRALHRHGIVHGDIKPENILITLRRDETGAYKEFYILADLGMAGRAGQYPMGVSTGVAFGTTRYLDEPRGRGGPLTYQSDLYALKMVFIEMVQGERFNERVPNPPTDLITDATRGLMPAPIARIVDESWFNIEHLMAMIQAASEYFSP